MITAIRINSNTVVNWDNVTDVVYNPSAAVYADKDTGKIKCLAIFAPVNNQVEITAPHLRISLGVTVEATEGGQLSLDLFGDKAQHLWEWLQKACVFDTTWDAANE